MGQAAGQGRGRDELSPSLSDPILLLCRKPHAPHGSLCLHYWVEKRDCVSPETSPWKVSILPCTSLESEWGTKDENSPAHPPAEPHRGACAEAMAGPLQRHRTQRCPLRCHLQWGQPATPEVSGTATALRGLGCECVLSFALFTLVPALQSLMSWVYSKTRQREPDAKPNCVGAVSLHFGVKKLHRGQKGTRYRYLLGGVFEREWLPRVLSRAPFGKVNLPGTVTGQSKAGLRPGTHLFFARERASWGPSWGTSS